MNQILSTDNDPKKQKKNEILDMRKIVIIFSILVIIFAVIIVGVKIISEFKPEKPVVILNRPEIEIKKVNDSLCQIDINYDEGIDKVTYWWNDGDVIARSMNGSTNFTTTLSIPEQDYNTLYVKASGIDGSGGEKNTDFISAAIADPEKPNIDLLYNESTKIISIVVKSEKGLEKISYNWENDENVEIELNGEKEFTIELEAKRGDNILHVEATDMEGNAKKMDKNMRGIKEPEFEIYLENEEYVVVKVTHDKGFKKIIVKINNQELVYDENNPEYIEERKIFGTKCKIEPGELKVEVTAYTMEEPDKAYIENRHN